MRKEREQLINLVKLQAKEMEVLLLPLCVDRLSVQYVPHFGVLQALKAEINMLRHKGGHIYTPVSRH